MATYIEMGTGAFFKADMITEISSNPAGTGVYVGLPSGSLQRFHQDRIPAGEEESVVVDILRELGRPSEGVMGVITFLNGQVVTRSLPCGQPNSG